MSNLSFIRISVASVTIIVIYTRRMTGEFEFALTAPLLELADRRLQLADL